MNAVNELLAKTNAPDDLRHNVETTRLALAVWANGRKKHSLGFIRYGELVQKQLRSVMMSKGELT